MGDAIVDVSTWVVLADEPAGADGKAWLTPPGAERSESRADWWLFKPAKTGLVKARGGAHATEYRRNDDRVERIASQLARCLELPAAEVRLARRDALEGCLSRYVIPDEWSMASGDLLLAEFDGYVPCANDPKVKERSGHNLSNIQVLMDGLFGPPFGAFANVPAFDVFAGYLVFDAWIANTDRHAVNWAMLYRGNDVCLAPSFDHGSALGSGLRDTGIPADVDAWCARGMAGRFEGGRSKTLVDLALDAVERGGPKASDWLTKLAAITPEQSRGILRGVPGLSVATSTFMGTVLETNQRRLCA